MEFNFNKTSKIFESKHFKWALAGLGVLVLMLFCFGAGIAVGYHKARFSYDWGENYDRNFGGPHHGIFGMFGDRDRERGGLEHGFMNAHGTFGAILSITSSTLAINGRDNIEKTVLISSSTLVRVHRDTISFADLKVGDNVVVLGNPNDKGQIEARLIRALW